MGYPMLRSILAGDSGPATKNKSGIRAAALGILGYSLGMAALVGTISYLKYGDKYQGLGDWHFWMVPVATFIGVATFATIGYGALEITTRKSYQRIQKKLDKENKQTILLVVIKLKTTSIGFLS